MVQHLVTVLKKVGFSCFADIAIVTLVIYTFLIGLKQTRRSGMILTGVLIVGAIYLAARKLNLVLTVALLHGFFAVILIALVVIFQEDLRYFFERVAQWWLERRLPLANRAAARLARPEAEVLARALSDLARAHIGALVVVRGRDTIARHLAGGQEVKGLISEPLLKSIFDPHSPGHDGALIVDGAVIDKLGCYLPLSKDLGRLGQGGTRHAAALGLSERSDALCLVVSEERGTLVAVRRGEVRPLNSPGEVVGALEAFYDEIAPRPRRRPGQEFLLRNFREKALALGLALTLWLVLVHRSQNIQRTYLVPIGYNLLPSTLTLAAVEPPTVEVTFSGPRIAFVLLRPDSIKLVLNLWDARKGRRQVRLTAGDLAYPSQLELEDIEPRQVTLDLQPRRRPAEVGNP